MHWQDKGISRYMRAVSIRATKELSAELIIGQHSVVNIVNAPTWIVGKQCLTVEALTQGSNVGLAVVHTTPFAQGRVQQKRNWIRWVWFCECSWNDPKEEEEELRVRLPCTTVIPGSYCR
jgi:hypothetical protein